MLSHIKAEVIERLWKQGYDISGEAVKAGNQNRYIAILLSYESLYPRDQALRPESLARTRLNSVDGQRGSAVPTAFSNLGTSPTKISSDIFTILGESSRSFHKS